MVTSSDQSGLEVSRKKLMADHTRHQDQDSKRYNSMHSLNRNNSWGKEQIKSNKNISDRSLLYYLWKKLPPACLDEILRHALEENVILDSVVSLSRRSTKSRSLFRFIFPLVVLSLAPNGISCQIGDGTDRKASLES